MKKEINALKAFIANVKQVDGDKPRNGPIVDDEEATASTQREVIEELKTTGVDSVEFLVTLDAGANCSVIKDHC